MYCKIIVVSLIVMNLLCSCSFLIKNAINKNYPPVDVIDKKNHSVQASTQVLLNTNQFDAEAAVSGYLVDTASNEALKKSNGVFVVTHQILDSLKINDFKTSFRRQEITVQSSQMVYLATTTNKWISGVEFYVSASLSPYYSNDTIYFNPFFNRVHLKKVYFKKCAFLTKLQPLTGLLNSIFDDYLANINGQVKNYFVVVSYPQDKQINLSSIFAKQPNVDIEKDGVINWHKRAFSSSLLVRNNELDFLLGENHAISSDTTLTGLAGRSKRKLFRRLYDSYLNSFDSVRYAYFDSTGNDSGFLVKLNITNSFLQNTLNDGLSNIDFRFKYPFGYNVNGLQKEITLKKPNPDCGCDAIVNNIFHCSGGIGGIPCRIARTAAMGACYAGSFGIPGISTYMGFCLAMKALPADFQWTIGEVKGSAEANASMHSVLSSIVISDNFSRATINKQFTVDGSINYDLNFSSFNKFNIGSTIFAILTQCPFFEMKGHPTISGIVPNDLVIDISKEQDNNKSTLILTLDPFQASVNLSQSPGLAIVSDFKNYFTCNIGYSVIGILFTMAHIIPDNVIPEKFRDYYDVFTQGKLDHRFELKSFKIPLQFTTTSFLGEISAEVYWRTKSVNSVCFLRK